MERIGEDNYLYRTRHWLLNRRAKKVFSSFGRGSEFRPGAYAAYAENIVIGSNVIIRPGCRLFADADTFIIIGDDVLLGHGVHIYTNNHSFMLTDVPICNQGYDKQENAILEPGCWVGANSIILPGVIVGRNAVVGAGSVVTKSVPDGEVWVGNPARKIKRGTENAVIRSIDNAKNTGDSASEGRLFVKRQKHSSV